MASPIVGPRAANASRSKVKQMSNEALRDMYLNEKTRKRDKVRLRGEINRRDLSLNNQEDSTE